VTIRGRVARAELISTGAGVKGRVLRAELFSQAASESVRGQVLRAELFSQDVVELLRGRVVRAELFSTGENATAISPSGPVPSHSYVTLAAAYNGSTPTPVYQWAQVSGPTVTLTPNDALATCVVKIPALWAPSSSDTYSDTYSDIYSDVTAQNRTPVVVQVRVLESDGATPWAQCTLSVAQHEVWQIQAGTPPPPIGLFPDSGVFPDTGLLLRV
jgi:hypothetical protein